jgi:Domain of Unknown Function (DUF928)
VKFNSGHRASLLVLGWLLSCPIALQMSLTSAKATPIKLKLPPPPQRGIAGNRSAAASRDKCPQVSPPLTALVPKYQERRVWGLTQMERPTFWFYVPYTNSSIVDMSFTLQDESNPAETKIVYENLTISPAQKSGLMQVTLPSSIEPLATNKTYHWFLKLNMGCRSGQRPLFVDGWVQRIDMDRHLSVQIQQATPTAKVALYAENGLWYDALATLANLRLTQPQDTALNQDWQNLLDAIELGELASQPYIEHGRSSRVQQSIKTGF